MRRLAVIAGTPVDTRMGVDFIEEKNREAGERIFEPVYIPAADGCDEQMLFQYGSVENKRKRMDEIFDAEIEKGTRDFFIYCNSLSGAFDFDSYGAEKSKETGADINICTPMQLYRELGQSYSCLGVIAAHNMSAHAIEEALMSSNPDIYVIGSGNMRIVRMIEEGAPSNEIVEDCGLKSLTYYMQACGAEAVLLGCTHFPCLKSALEELTELPVIDPAAEMYELLFCC